VVAKAAQELIAQPELMAPVVEAVAAMMEQMDKQVVLEL
jgi:hypothetical protein